jgi:hypothetical protein
VRHEWVTSAEAEGADATVAIHCSLLATHSRGRHMLRTRAAGRLGRAFVVLGALCASERCAGERGDRKGGGEDASDHVGTWFSHSGCRVRVLRAWCSCQKALDRVNDRRQRVGSQLPRNRAETAGTIWGRTGNRVCSDGAMNRWMRLP